MDLTKETFIQIAALSSNDYEITGNKISISIKRGYEYYQKYKDENTDTITFYEWLVLQNVSVNYNELLSICKLFDIGNSIPQMQEFVEIKKMSKPRLNLSAIKAIMRSYNFIFV
jgi:hypothetical protein